MTVVSPTHPAGSPVQAPAALGLDEARIPASEVRAGKLQSFAALATRTAPVHKGGTAHAGQVHHGDATWLVDLLYCPNPGCDCREAHILASQQPPGDEVEARSADVPWFHVRTDLAGRTIGVHRSEHCDEVTALAVAADWLAAVEDVAGTLQGQYDAVREVGARAVASVSSRIRAAAPRVS